MKLINTTIPHKARNKYNITSNKNKKSYVVNTDTNTNK